MKEVVKEGPTIEYGAICTRDQPNRRAQIHPDAKEYREQTDGWPSGDIAHYKCPNCEKCFDVELPQ